MFAAGGCGTLSKLCGIDVAWNSEHKTFLAASWLECSALSLSLVKLNTNPSNVLLVVLIS